MSQENPHENPSHLAGHLTRDGHELSVRVYFEDTDFTGVVYHARYAQFFERGRSDFLRLKDINHDKLKNGLFGEPLYFIVKSIAIDFSAPAHIDDILQVETLVSSHKGARLAMHQKIRRGTQTIASADVVVVLIDENGKPKRLPDELIQALVNS